MSNLTDFIGGSGGGVTVSLNGSVGKGYIKHPDYNSYNIPFGLINNKLTSGATARNAHSAIYFNDGTNNKMIVFGGYDGKRLNDTWEYNIGIAVELVGKKPIVLVAKVD